MFRPKFLKLAVAAFTLLAPAAGLAEVRTQPNIVIVLADDLGFSDLGCYGGEIDTPNLDALAAKGVRFSQAYNAARCCPSRASLLTGLYPHQAGIGAMTQPRKLPAYRGALAEEAVTIAEVLGGAGYQTWAVGKWHLSPDYDQVQKPSASWPLQRGFARFYGTLPAAVSMWDPPLLMRDNTFIQPEFDDYYYTEAITNNAIRFIRESDANRPFFLYVAHGAPHWPLHARDNVIAKYRGRFASGWDQLRIERHARLIKAGAIDARTQLSPRDEQSRPWDDAPNHAWEQRRMEVYAAMVDEMDQQIGRLIATLKAEGRYENTLFIFLSDNGASPEGHLNGMVERLDRPWKGRFISRETRDGQPIIVGDFPEVMPGGRTTFASYDVKWANLCNTPFRLNKSWAHEGGISTPLIAHWPAAITSHGQWQRQPVHLIDLMATCVDVSKAAYPKTRNGLDVPPMEGVSLVPAFQDQPLKRETLFWEHEGNRAVRRGDWKLVSEFPGEWNRASATDEWELYNMATDRSELRNLAKDQPERVRELSELYESWAKRTGVLPWRVILDEYPIDP